MYVYVASYQEFCRGTKLCLYSSDWLSLCFNDWGDRSMHSCTCISIHIACVMERLTEFTLLLIIRCTTKMEETVKSAVIRNGTHYQWPMTTGSVATCICIHVVQTDCFSVFNGWDRSMHCCMYTITCAMEWLTRFAFSIVNQCNP